MGQQDIAPGKASHTPPLQPDARSPRKNNSTAVDEPMLKECIVKEDGRRLCYFWFGERAEERARRTGRAE